MDVEKTLHTSSVKRVSYRPASGNQDLVQDAATLSDRDTLRLSHFGKKQRFRRNFGLLSIVGLSCTLMITWEGTLILLQPLFLNGGPTGAFTAFFFVIFGVLTQVLVMAELASMIPLAGGQFNWVAILSPPAWSPFLSYVTGWLTVIAWQASCIGETYINANLIQQLIVLNNPSYEPQPWQALLIFYAIIGLSLLVTTIGGRIFPKFEALTLFLHVMGFFAILITLVYLGPKNPPELVFDSFLNGGGFSSYGVSWLVGAVTVAFTFIGIDAATHMAEEIANAEVVIPRAMITSVLLNGSMGVGILVAFLFTMGPIDDILSSDFSYPFVTVFQNITQSTGGATAMAAVLLTIAISGSIGLVATASRMIWAFAREGGLPASGFLSKIDARISVPVNATLATALINMLMALISLGSTTAFNAFTGLTVAGFYSAFMISAAVMLHKRLTTPADRIMWGSFRLGKAGVPITIIALMYSVVGWLFSFFPPETPVTAANWNWSFVVYWSVLLLAGVWWVVRARKTFTGPKLEFDAAKG